MKNIKYLILLLLAFPVNTLFAEGEEIIQMLEQKIKTLEDQATLAEESRITSEEKQRKLDEELAGALETNKNYIQLLNDSQNANTELEEMQQVLEEEVAKIQLKLEHSEKDNTENRLEVEKLERYVNDLEILKKHAESTIDKLEKEKKENEIVIENLEKKRTQSEKDYTESQKKITDTSTELDELKKEYALLKQSMRTKIEDMNKLIDHNVKIQNDQNKKSNDYLDTAIQKVEELNKAAAATQSVFAQDLELKKNTNAERKRRIEELKIRNKQYEEAREKSKKIFEERNTDQSSTDSQLSCMDMKQKITDLRANLESLQAQLSKTQCQEQ
ncbi:coiled-coil domain-containing protein [Holospora undulata]|uniref:Chromosome partition protein Smc n=1 Tax=Holospora undulata HU1 TaxID=1321371 RepID=A0A061JGI6_9PROT|nr:hypothetical protein [Holospora undulata]ETZ05160.1 hypothetical protein K737_300414 [Holospora undulata HU1]